MDYWAETMQDDAYLIAADGWVKGAQPREIVRVKNKNKKLVWPEPHDYLKGKRRFKSDLVPAPILVARYFVAERDAIEEIDNQLATLAQQLDEMRQENCGEDGLLAEVIEGEGNKQKITAKAVKARLKEIGKDPVHAGERAGLEAYAGLLKQQTEAKAKRKAAQKDLDKEIDAKYPTLTEAEIKDAGGGRQVDDPCVCRRAGRARPRLADPRGPHSPVGRALRHAATEAHRRSGDARRQGQRASQENGIVMGVRPGYKQTEVG